MKIFVDGYLLNKEYQGTRTYIVEIYKALSLLKPNFYIEFGVNDLNEELIAEFSGFSNIHFYIFKEKNKWKRMFTEYSDLSFQYDFMHFQYIIPFRVRNKKCRIINTIHDVLFLDYPKGFPFMYRLSRQILFKRSAIKCDILLTVSTYSKTKISKHFNISENKIYITPNGVNLNFLEDYDKQEARRIIDERYKIKDYILYVSRIEPRKNQVQLLELFSNSKAVYEKNNLVFIGKKSLESTDFFDLLKNLPTDIRQKVFYIEQIDNNDLIKVYRAASYFVYPSLYEGFGIPPIEAAAAKIPVLCNNKTAMLDFSMLNPYLIDFNNADISMKFNDFVLNNSSNLNFINNEIKKRYTWNESAKVLINCLLLS